MIKYKIVKHDDHYVLFKIIFNDRSIGSYRVISGSLKEIKKFVKEHNINLKVGVRLWKMIKWLKRW